MKVIQHFQRKLSTAYDLPMKLRVVKNDGGQKIHTQIFSLLDQELGLYIYNTNILTIIIFINSVHNFVGRNEVQVDFNLV